MGATDLLTSILTVRSFELLPASFQYILLVVGVFLFFGIHNYLQEAIMNIEGFSFGVMLGYTEVLGVALCSFIERKYIAKEKGRIAPISAYPLLTLCLMGSSALSNISLNFINFPTKVVFRSCKLIPTMIIASIIHQKKFSMTEYFCAIAISSGLVMFAAAGWEATPSFHPIGLVLVSLSVFADAILPNAQERLFRMGASRLEVTLYTNVFSLIAYTVSTLLSGDLRGCIQQTIQNRQLAMYFLIYTFVAYIAISVHMTVVKRFGGVTAVLIATGRKGMTLVISFLLFPKAFSLFYPVGACMVLGGLLVSSLIKIQSKSKTKNDPRRTIKEHVSDLELTAPLKKDSENC